MIDVIIYFVFVLALIAFALSPAIYVTNRLSNKFVFIENNSTKISILFAILFSSIATFFIFWFWQMISSNYDILLFKTNVNNNLEKNIDNIFSNSVENILNKNKKRDNSLTFSNINGITLKEIDELFEDEDKKNLAKNLRLATLFTNDGKLANILFDTVLGKPFDSGFEYLSNRYSDKNNYLKSKNNFSSSTLFDMLHKSMEYRLNSSNKSDIKKEDLDDILLEINSFDFISALSSSSKKGSKKYKDQEKYSFLYKNYELEYKNIMEKYQDLDKKNLDILSFFKIKM